MLKLLPREDRVSQVCETRLGALLPQWTGWKKEQRPLDWTVGWKGLGRTLAPARDLLGPFTRCLPPVSRHALLPRPSGSGKGQWNTLQTHTTGVTPPCGPTKCHPDRWLQPTGALSPAVSLVQEEHTRGAFSRACRVRHLHLMRLDWVPGTQGRCRAGAVSARPQEPRPSSGCCPGVSGAVSLGREASCWKAAC